jgi:hypothetical protein
MADAPVDIAIADPAGDRYDIVTKRLANCLFFVERLFRTPPGAAERGVALRDSTSCNFYYVGADHIVKLIREVNKLNDRRE